MHTFAGGEVPVSFVEKCILGTTMGGREEDGVRNVSESANSASFSTAVTAWNAVRRDFLAFRDWKYTVEHSSEKPVPPSGHDGELKMLGKKKWRSPRWASCSPQGIRPGAETGLVGDRRLLRCLGRRG